MSESKYDSVKKKELSDQELHDINCSSDFTDTCDYGLLQESVLGLYTTMQEFASHPIFKSHVQNEAFKMIDIDNQLKTRNRDLTEDHAIIFAGETGAGKSTVINLLINEEEDVLPVDITATTSRLCKILNCDPMVILTKNHENKTIEERKFQSHEKSNMISSLRDLVRTDDPKVRSINICHPVPIQQVFYLHNGINSLYNISQLKLG
ncbi:uncharacterized protein LOC134232158 [Saccostrea cucullata]|uniref:uncharacterized protein LOC134232158 n=1 Tax=Saccostrea cuccullata TaxID=36930 RepID=UPI002ED1D0C3